MGTSAKLVHLLFAIKFGEDMPMEKGKLKQQKQETERRGAKMVYS